MKAITLNDVINKKYKNKEFADHFQRELLVNEIAKMVVQLRQEANLTQQELADKAGTTQPVIARLESGADSRIPSLELLTKLAIAADAKIKIAISHGSARQKSAC
jgi:transcriptional regulator with XRE-family HTH domain